ncbi:E3 ubiquitin-protein ligase rnf146 [Chionoecetes opilio]|uniref:E3 ubiquitin-protein ligase n=1 Tax=Chionoecetes opilio TaxID=41210 RepID=A0A8J4XZR5_CHIOP|nr:E3 ubiquitin-protein ligase rnf146 [Chionoecetes opilio]
MSTGWWRYDERTNSDLEEAYTQGHPTVTLLIAAHSYVVDFSTMRQSRSNDPTLSRHIKRDDVTTIAKGTAGLSNTTLYGKGQDPPPGQGQGRGRGRGRCRGWWQYDERTSHELEAAYGSGQRACEVLVAGFLYIIDFDRMVQLRRNDPSRRRRIKRDLSSIPKKGVAGIKLPSQLEAELSALHTAAHAIQIPSHREGEMGDSTSPAPSNNNNNDLCPRTPTAPSNTPQTPHTPSAASSSSGSPDTSEPTHLHALTADSHHHHYHHHLPPHYPNIQHNNQLHIPHHLANNLSVGSEHGTFPPPPAGQPTRPPPLPSSIHPQPSLHATQPSLEPRDTSAPVSPASSSLPAADVEEAVYQVEQLSLLPDTPEFYPLDGPDETEQYHLTLSSEDDKMLIVHNAVTRARHSMYLHKSKSLKYVTCQTNDISHLVSEHNETCNTRVSNNDDLQHTGHHGLTMMTCNTLVITGLTMMTCNTRSSRV